MGRTIPTHRISISVKGEGRMKPFRHNTLGNDLFRGLIIVD
jgi:hypothetical protein